MMEAIHEIVLVSPLSAGKVLAVFGLVMGLIGGFLSLISFGLIGSYLAQVPGVDTAAAAQLQQFGFTAFILSLVLGVVIGFIAGALAGFVFNVTAKLVGGLKVHIKEQ